MSWGQSVIKSLSKFFDQNSFVTYSLSSIYGTFKEKIEGIFKRNDMITYNIPKIIVIGEESSGKSSLLENITKCPIFPRDSKICTKIPIHLTLKHNTECYNEIRYHGKTSVIDKMSIGDEIIKIFADMGNDVDDDPIEVLISAPNLQEFEFYDLPGIRAYPEEMAEKTKQICEKYLTMDDVLILCVIPATNPRLTSSEALALVQKHNKSDRTILALTMVDRLQPANIKDLLIDRLLGESDELENIGLAGCLGVFNRTHSDTVNLKTHHDTEQSWFKENILDPMPEDFKSYRSEIENNIGSYKLIIKLNDLFKHYICENWIPKAVDKARDRLKVIEGDIKKLGDDPCNLNLPKVLEILMEKIDMLWIDDNDFNVNTNVDIKSNSKIIPEPKNIQIHCLDKPIGKDECVKRYIFRSRVRDSINQYIVDVRRIYINKISACFDDKCSYKLIRFSCVNEYICAKFDEFYRQNEEIFIKNLDMHLISAMPRINCRYSGEIDNRYMNIARDLILNEILFTSVLFLSASVVDLNFNEILSLFVENQTYLTKRNSLTEKRNKIIQGITELNDLKNESN